MLSLVWCQDPEWDHALALHFCNQSGPLDLGQHQQGCLAEGCIGHTEAEGQLESCPESH